MSVKTEDFDQFLRSEDSIFKPDMLYLSFWASSRKTKNFSRSTVFALVVSCLSTQSSKSLLVREADR